jgi:hypothetical protein
MLIDCGRCAVRGAACTDCVVSALFDAPAHVAGLTDAERRAIEAFDRAGFEVEIIEAPPPPRPLKLTGRIRRPRHVA